VATVDQTQFLDKYRALQTPAYAELVAVLKLWLPEGKSDDEIAAALGKNRSTATRKIGDICKYFGTDAKGKKEQRQQLVLLFRRYCSDFEVHSSLYPDWIEPNSIATKPENTVSEVVQITPVACTEFDLLGRESDRPVPKLIQETVCNSSFIGRDRVLTELDGLFVQNRLILIYGEGGLGKSTVAKFYCQKLKFNDFYKLGTVGSSDIANAESLVDRWLQEFFGEETSRQEFSIKLERLRKHLQDDDRNICFVLDNLEPALINGRFKEENTRYVALLGSIPFLRGAK